MKIFIIIVSIVILLLVILSNIQLYIMGKYIDDTTTDFPEATIFQPEDVNNNYDTFFQPEDINNNYNTILQQSDLKSIKQQLEYRIIIDDFYNPALWTGVQNEAEQSGSIKVSCENEIVEIYRKFDGFLDLQTYLFLDFEVKSLENIKSFSLFLLEDLSYANYYVCNLVPLISENNNSLIINQKDCLIGSGIPKWDKISTIKISIETKDNTKSNIIINEISTYNAYPMCSIWFDDGWASTYSQAFPAMKERDFKGILSIISSHINYESYCKDLELDTMYEYGWNFVNHTYSHKNLTELQTAEVEYEIASCLEYLQSHGYTRASNHFVPPYCATNDSVDNVIKNYAISSRPGWEEYNYLPIVDPYYLCFKEVTNETTPEMVYDWISEAIEYDLWLILLFHSIESPADTPYKYDVQNFNNIIEYLYENRLKIEVVTLSQIFDIDNIIQENDVVSQNQVKGEWELIWEDNFDFESLNESNWNIISAEPFKNNELQIYSKDNISIEDGLLILNSEIIDNQYLSGAITTENKKIFKYGKLEIRAKLPVGKGIFPAFWMLPQSGDSLPEIDIMEFLGNHPNKVWHVMHFENDDKKNDRYYKVITGQNFSEDYHIFTLEWSADSLKWFIDGIETYSIDKDIPSEKMYLYINTAIGGNWPGTPDSTTEFPQTLLIDYVKYYTKNR